MSLFGKMKDQDGRVMGHVALQKLFRVGAKPLPQSDVRMDVEQL